MKLASWTNRLSARWWKAVPKATETLVWKADKSFKSLMASVTSFGALLFGTVQKGNMLVHFVLNFTHTPVKPCGMVSNQGAFPSTLLPPSKDFLRDRPRSRSWRWIRGNLGNTWELWIQSCLGTRPAKNSPSGSLVAILFESGLCIPFSLAFRCSDKLVLFQTRCFLGTGRVTFCSTSIELLHFIAKPVVLW